MFIHIVDEVVNDMTHNQSFNDCGINVSPSQSVLLNVPEEQPAAQAANPTVAVTQADLAAMEKRYKDVLRDALTPFHVAQQTPTACPPALVAP
ncbi:hypothetical protein E5676_scaffold530G00290 [Cucumis melo var. makuwa]|uniref:Histone H2B.3-like n=1 Tax=Cucumis melo var. makuwa TaxID=1194695 RepID=A0A5A7VHE9_CUCMM|nr:hypothetical protein E6C27_scaffold50G00300 [Cucumis melo var. makuwa]TYK22432.1 hypothetical protein E5676_scaffold530G00290 [Cucumis melo var. makuwa]